MGGIWDRDIGLTIDRSFRDGKEWSIAVVESLDFQSEIRGICLKTLILRQNGTVDILKIDVEGAERYLFRNPDYVKDFLQYVKCLVIEIHDEFEMRERIFRELASCNFLYFNHGESTIAVNRSYISV